MRSWLTVLGIIIGIMLVVVILSLGSGIREAVRKQLQTFGSDLIIIMPGEETNPFIGLIGEARFNERDLLDLGKIEGVEFVALRDIKMLNAEYRGEIKSVLVSANLWKSMIKLLEESEGLRLAEGRWPSGEDAGEVVLGFKARSSLFQQPVRIGDEIIIKSKRLRVVGVLSEIGVQIPDNAFFISLKVLRDITGSGAVALQGIIKAVPGADLGLITRQIRFQLSKQKVIQDFAVFTPDKADRIVGDVLLIVELLLVAIALISLIVGAVGIMNTMYTSVLERTKQIGVMKAIGAPSEEILFLFLLESGMIGLIGGILGIISGVLLAYVIGVIAGQFGVSGLFSFASLDYFGFIVVLIVTFITGIAAGILPARQAAKLEPAEALRYE